MRVHFLEEHQEYGIVTSDASIRKGNIHGSVAGYMSELFPQDNENPYQFELLLNGRSILCSGCHMVRREAILATIPDREIYPARRGQNWQLLLPVCYRYKRGFLKKPLYRYVEYPTSMSHGDDTVEKHIMRTNEHERILINTIEKISMSIGEKRKYLRLIKKRIQKIIFDTCIQYSDLKRATGAFKELLVLGYLDKNMVVDYLVLVRKHMMEKN